MKQSHQVPTGIVGRLRAEGIGVMSIETIYLHIWQDRTEGGTFWRHLRGANKQRRKRYARKDRRGRLAGKRMITERPPIFAARHSIQRLGDRHRPRPRQAGHGHRG